MSTVVRSHAKINLGLAIGAPRPDGFHALSTVYQTLELHDLVTVTARPAQTTALSLTSNDERVPTDSRNTAWKMVALALDALGMTAEVEIHIEKRLPVQGGLGAGSANAVAALVGLENELGIGAARGARGRRDAGPSTTPSLRSGSAQDDCSPIAPREATLAEEQTQILRCAQDDSSFFAQDDGEEAGPSTAFNATYASNFAQDDRFIQDDQHLWRAKRLQIAAQVGSDVPLFLIGGTILGLDRGQEVYPLPDLDPVWCVVATPAVGVSTPQAFRDWDELCAAEGLTQEASAGKLIELSRAYASAFAQAAPAGAIPRESVSEGRPGAGSSGVLLSQKDLAGPQESALVRTGICRWIANDFERVVFRQQPSLRAIKRLLAASDTPEAALHASLSGSGSALFGLYLARGAAQAACQRLSTAGVESHLTRTLPRSSYWSQMLAGTER
jgi:4-diphosphocytidyl-2C-methyl-D-erythritol kinase